MALSDITLDTNPRATLRLMDQINVLTMSPVQKRRMLRHIGKDMRTDLRNNIKRQRTITGSGMAPRAGKRKKRMFSKMAKGTVTRILNDHKAIVTWKQAGQAKVAYRHHHGIAEDYTAAKAAKIYGVPNYQKPATPAQAKSLNKEGFRRKMARKRGKGKAIMKKVPQKWIRSNMSQGQAGLILRLMRTKTRKGKQRWVIKPPERPILGASSADANKYLTAMAQNALQQINKV